MPWPPRSADVRLLPALVRAGWQLFRNRHPTVGSLVRERAQATPDRIFLRFEDRSIGWGEFNDGVNAYAAVYRQAGVGREPVALMMENSPALLMAQVAAAKVGAVAALINTHLSGAPLTNALRASTARHVFADAACLARAVAPPESASLTIWGKGDPAELPPHVEPLDAALAAAVRNEPRETPVRPEDVYLYLFTGGTTGNPKPTIVRHHRFTMAGVALGSLLDVGPDDVLYTPLPFYHGLSNLIGFSVAAYRGATLASRRRFSPEAALEDIHRHRATALVYIGELCRHLLRASAADSSGESTLRLAVGAGLRPDIWETFRERFGLQRIVESYGLSEGNISLLNLSGRPGSVGRPLPLTGAEVRVVRVDPNSRQLVRGGTGFLEECADGEIGELVSRVSDRSWMRLDGYVDAKATEARIVHDAFRRGDRWFRSGDLLARDASGDFDFVDRGSDSLACGDTFVSTLRIADVLLRAADIVECAAYGVAVPGRPDAVPMAALVMAPGAMFDGRALYKAAAELPTVARPVFLRCMAKIDVTGVLRHRKSELQRQGYDPARIQEALYVRDDTTEDYVPLTTSLLAALRRGRWVASGSVDSYRDVANR